jgi:desulfoferrodoxin (superoxide reductase-like protein)
MWVDVILRHDAEEAHYLPWIELVLALYGFTFAGFSFARGRLRISDWVTLTTCLVLFSFTAYTALLVPLVWHN